VSVRSHIVAPQATTMTMNTPALSRSQKRRRLDSRSLVVRSCTSQLLFLYAVRTFDGDVAARAARQH
jgi:hypothetical protein